MTTDSEFKDYVFNQMKRFGKFDTKNMFGGTALLRNGKAFAKIKHGSLWLKTDNGNLNDFLEQGMNQYAYGKDNSRTLNFYETPVEVLEFVVPVMYALIASKSGEATEEARMLPTAS